MHIRESYVGRVSFRDNSPGLSLDRSLEMTSASPSMEAGAAAAAPKVSLRKADVEARSHTLLHFNTFCGPLPPYFVPSQEDEEASRTGCGHLRPFGPRHRRSWCGYHPPPSIPLDLQALHPLIRWFQLYVSRSTRLLISSPCWLPAGDSVGGRGGSSDTSFGSRSGDSSSVLGGSRSFSSDSSSFSGSSDRSSRSVDRWGG